MAESPSPGSIVFRHPSGGSLRQGDRHDARRAAEQRPLRVKLLVLCAGEVPHPSIPDELEAIALPFDDRLLRGSSVRLYADAAWEVALRAAHLVRTGRRVLSTCAAGLNRSGLVSGLTLRALGLHPEEVIRLVRKARGADALGNASFTAIIRGVRPTSGVRS